MATSVIGKRKREDVPSKNGQLKKAATLPSAAQKHPKKILAQSKPKPKPEVANQNAVAAESLEATNNGAELSSLDEGVVVQIVTGSYERVLHGISASIPAQLLQRTTQGQTSHEDTAERENGRIEDVFFSDTFLFAAHTSSIRCLVVSPPTDSNLSKRILATGGSDERINLYNISTTPPTPSTTKSKPSLPVSLTGSSTAENARNISVGNLIHHDRAITCLHFPTKSKLFSAAEDNNIAISRTRDWTVLSSIKAPIPKPQGRPSGDTATPGEVPAGVNDFAIHPSQKLMLSVGRGEKCMRLWNLMTGKKAGVLNFDRELLSQVGEGKYGSGEGRRVLWDEDGEMYVIGFERGAAVFGIDSKPKAIVRPQRPTKLHQMTFLPKTKDSLVEDVLAISTEDGRILFVDAQVSSTEHDVKSLPLSPTIAQLGGPAAGMSGRIKDFEILQLPPAAPGVEVPLLIVTGSSDGAVRLWTVFVSEMVGLQSSNDVDGDSSNGSKTNRISNQARQVGTLIGPLETGNRITCLGAFIMDGKPSDGGADMDDGAALGAEGDDLE